MAKVWSKQARGRVVRSYQFRPQVERLDERTLPSTLTLSGMASGSSLPALLAGAADCAGDPTASGRCAPELSESLLTLLYVYSQTAVDLVLGPVWGQPVRDIYRAFLDGPFDHREYGDGHEVIEGNDRALGFRDSPTTRLVAGRLLQALRLALEERLAGPPPKGIDCGSLPADEEFALPIRRTVPEGLLTPAELRPLELSLEYDAILEIPGIMAGGLSDSLGAGMDDRALEGALVVTRRTSGGQTVALDLRTELTVSVRDSIDFCPGGLGDWLAQLLTRPLQLLQANFWAVAVPFTATFTATPERLTLAGDDLPAACRPRFARDAGRGQAFAPDALGLLTPGVPPVWGAAPTPPALEAGPSYSVLTTAVSRRTPEGSSSKSTTGSSTRPEISATSAGARVWVSPSHTPGRAHWASRPESGPTDKSAFVHLFA